MRVHRRPRSTATTKPLTIPQQLYIRNADVAFRIAASKARHAQPGHGVSTSLPPYAHAEAVPTTTPPVVVADKKNNNNGNAVLALHALRDAHVVYAIDGEIQFVVTLAQLFGGASSRHLSAAGGGTLSLTTLHATWRRALDALRPFIGDGVVPRRVITTRDSFRYAWKEGVVDSIQTHHKPSGGDATVDTPHTDVHAHDHYAALAVAGFFASPFDRALVVAYGAAANDGAWSIYVMDRGVKLGDKGSMELVERIDVDVVTTQCLLANALVNLVGRANGDTPASKTMLSATRSFAAPFYERVRYDLMEPMMGVSPLGVVNAEWYVHIRALFTQGSLLPRAVARLPCYRGGGGGNSSARECTLLEILSAQVYSPLNLAIDEDGFIEDRDEQLNFAATVHQVSLISDAVILPSFVFCITRIHMNARINIYTNLMLTCRLQFYIPFLSSLCLPGVDRYVARRRQRLRRQAVSKDDECACTRVRTRSKDAAPAVQVSERHALHVAHRRRARRRGVHKAFDIRSHVAERALWLGRARQ
jgi:hypothetical protein